MSGLITFVVLSNSICKKSFYQIYDELSKPNQTNKKKIQTINNLYYYIQEHSDEEILIFNFRFNRFKSNHWYSAILIAIISISILAMLKFEFSFYGRILIIFLICIGYFIPIFFVLRRFGILGFDVVSIKNILVIYSGFILVRVAITYIIFLASILLLLAILNQFVELKPTTSFFDVFTPYINSGGLESISSSQLSLAGFFFTFAIGGTVIFSIISNYLKQKNELENTLLEDSDSYIKWFESNENNLIFKTQMTKMNSKIKDYRRALKDLRSEFNFDSVNSLIVPVKRYESFRLLIAIMYFLGILTLLLTKPLMNLLFLFFILFSLLFMLSIYDIFKDYS